MTEQDLTDRVAIVTGAANGIGKAVATTLAERGAHIVVADVETGPAQPVTAALPTKAALWAGDLASAGATDQVVATALDTFGRLDIVVNNAGYSHNAAIEDMFRDVLEIDLVVPWLLLKVAAPHLKASAEAAAFYTAALPMIPLGRYGRVDEVAATVAFLSTAGSDYITGQVVNLSGGAPTGMTS